MPRKKKDEIISELTQQIETYQKWLKDETNKNAELMGRADESFVTSQYRQQLEDERDLFKRLYESQQSSYTKLKVKYNQMAKQGTVPEEDTAIDGTDVGTPGMYEGLIRENNELRARLESSLEKNEMLMAEIVSYRDRLSKLRGNSGRPAKLSQEDIDRIKELRFDRKMTLRQIAEEMGCSTGLVHKLINEHKVD